MFKVIGSHLNRSGRKLDTQALERLLAATPPGGTYEEVQFLPRDQAIADVRDVTTLGWLSAHGSSER